MNHFQLLTLTPIFDLDPKILESAYFAQQRLTHPDRFVKKSAEERQQALLLSIEVNAAYETLKKPLSRAQYLLHLQEIEVGTEADTVKPSALLLMETMEWREAIDEATPQALTNLNETLSAMHTQTIEAITTYYKACDWQAMAQETLKLGYVLKAQEALALRKVNA